MPKELSGKKEPKKGICMSRSMKKLLDHRGARIPPSFFLRWIKATAVGIPDFRFNDPFVGLDLEPRIQT